jgi:hypothetical protein
VRSDERLEGFDERLDEAVERLVKSGERPIDLIERLKTRNGGGLAAWEPRPRGSLNTEKAGRPSSPRPPPSVHRGAWLFGNPCFWLRRGDT